MILKDRLRMILNRLELFGCENKMIDLSKLEYRLVAIGSGGEQHDLTGVTSGLNWTEAEKQLASKITCKLAAFVNDKPITDFVSINTQLIICADTGDGFQEVMRGNVQKLNFSESNREMEVNLEAADEAIALRQSQVDEYFTEDHSSTAILEKILNDGDIPHTIKITDQKHSKKVYRAKYLADIIADILKDIKEKDGGTYIVRAKGGVLEIIERGTNETIYEFSVENNVTRVSESLDASKLVTQVKICGKETKEGRPPVEATVDGNLELGRRTVIYHRSDKETLDEAQKAAEKILKENDIQRKTSFEAADLPFLRKGDLIQLRNSLGAGRFFVKSISHNADKASMRVELDYSKEKSEEAGFEVYQLAETAEFDSPAP